MLLLRYPHRTLIIYLIIHSISYCCINTQGIALPPLPYAYDALEPALDTETLRIHHDKHHAKVSACISQICLTIPPLIIHHVTFKYVDVATGMIKGTEMESWDVVKILRAAHKTNPALFNNAAQSFNHEFYWNCMTPNGGGAPTGRVLKLIDEAFGSYAEFRARFAAEGMATFGSGWVWLVWTPEGVKISKTIGAENPLTNEGEVPILTMDVWEHAYYLKYRNLRWE